MAWITIITVYFCCQLVLSLVVVILNLPFLITLVKKTSLRTPSNAALGCLCFSDLLTGILTLLLWSPNSSLLVEFSTKHITTLILISQLYVAITGFSSIFIAAVYLDRFFAICYPFKYTQYATPKLYTMVSLCSSLLYTVLISLCYAFDSSYYTYSIYLIVLFIVSMSIIIVTYCSWRIFKVSRRHSREIASVGQLHGRQNSEYHHESKRYKLIVVLVITFVVCNLPRIVYVYAAMFHSILEYSQGFLIFGTVADNLLLLNSIINPIVYYIRIRMFRSAMKDVFCCRQNTTVL